jgi:hypothetical protein
LRKDKVLSRGFFTHFPGTVQSLGQGFKQAAGQLEVSDIDQPLAGYSQSEGIPGDDDLRTLQGTG